MPSNVRKFDNSCQKTSTDRVHFYQCSTCDQDKLLYICEECKENGRHSEHDVNEVTLGQSQIFCCCGDITGQLSCSTHTRVIVRAIQKPLHVNRWAMDEFVREFDLDPDDFGQVALLNQIRKLHFKSADAKLIKHYFDNSNIRSKGNIKIIKTWSVYRKDAEKAFVANGYDKDRRLLLWHGTRTQNLSSILEYGFRKPRNPRNSVNGAMFGNGVYFADRVSKSALFCDRPGKGLLLLCEVCLGSMWRTGLPKNHTRAPPNFHSIKGIGKNVPDRNGEKKFDDVNVPAGRTIPNPHPAIKHSQINYNEYVVFDPDRILIKFIVEIYRK